MIPSMASRHSWFEATARARLAGLLDPASFTEILPPAASQPSPHLAQLDLPGAFDDGVIIGCGKSAHRGGVGKAVREDTGPRFEVHRSSAPRNNAV